MEEDNVGLNKGTVETEVYKASRVVVGVGMDECDQGLHQSFGPFGSMVQKVAALLGAALCITTSYPHPIFRNHLPHFSTIEDEEIP